MTKQSADHNGRTSKNASTYVSNHYPDECDDFKDGAPNYGMAFDGSMNDA
jgi:hypothetical protein